MRIINCNVGSRQLFNDPGGHTEKLCAESFYLCKVKHSNDLFVGSTNVTEQALDTGRLHNTLRLSLTALHDNQLNNFSIN